VMIRVKGVDMLKKQIDFELVDEDEDERPAHTDSKKKNVKPNKHESRRNTRSEKNEKKGKKTRKKR